MANVLKLSALVLCVIAIVIINPCGGQQLKHTVQQHFNRAVRQTRVRMGLPVEVQGDTTFNVHPAEAGGGQNLSFVVSARGLRRGIDPYIKISYRSNESLIDGSGGAIGQIGQTESAGDGVINPNWVQSFWFWWRKGTDQVWNFRLFDHKHSERLLAEAELDVDAYVEWQRSTVELNQGRILVQRTRPVQFTLAANHIRHRDEFNGKSDPYITVYYRTGLEGTDIKVGRTSTIRNVEHANWTNDIIEFTNWIPIQKQYLHFRLMDADVWTRDDPLGDVLVLADGIFDTKQQQTMYLENSGEHTTITITPIVQ